MRKLFVLSAFVLLTTASLTNTQAQVKPGNGLFQWDTTDLIGCGSGFN
ncbi:hypothetical protein [Chryseobacterium sp. SIMBA_038]